MTVLGEAFVEADALEGCMAYHEVEGGEVFVGPASAIASSTMLVGTFLVDVA